MKMKKAILLTIACSMMTLVSAQKSDTTIVFSKLVHDFGNIVNSEGPKSCSFEFTNNGDSPVSILRVVASCGCTTPGWTKEPVAPGAKGIVQATYVPAGTTTFNKSLTVYFSGGSPEVIVLRLTGKVKAR